MRSCGRVISLLCRLNSFIIIADYVEAMKEGALPAAYFRLMLLGAGGSGKSSLLDGLMNIPLQIAESTAIADTRKVTFQWVQAADAIDEAWKEYTVTDEESDLATYAQYHTENKKMAGMSLQEQSTIKPTNQFRLKTDTKFSNTPVRPGFVKKVSRLKIATYKDIFERVKDKTRQTGEKPNVVMHVWDCGGQPIFLDVLAAFLTSRTMFFLLFDASSGIQSIYKEKWHHKGQVIKGREQYITNIELTIQWLQLIHSSLVARKEGLPLSHSAGSLPKYPRAMLIGSRRDLITPQVASDTKSQLQSACTSAAFGDLVVDTLLVDITKAGKGKEGEDPCYKIIRSHIKNFADSLIVSTPLSWVALRQVLQKLSSGNPVLTYSQVKVIAEQCDIAESVVPSVLHFYHQLGAMLHYVNIPSLANTVIIEPQWLIQQLRLLLMPAWFGHRQQQLQRFWNCLDEKGILCEELYREIWKDCGLEGGPQALVDLLDHFDLAKRLEKFPHDMSFYKGLKYFVPCFLKIQPKSESESLSKFNPIREAAVLHILFNMSYVPPGFFVRLIAQMTNHKEYVPLLDQKEKVYRNSIVLQCRDIDRVIIYESLNSVSVKIFRVTNRKSYHCHFSKSCIQLREEVSSMCLDVLQKWMPSIEHKLAFICTYPGRSKNHFASLKSHHRDSIFYCDFDHICPLFSRHKFWLDPSNQKVSLCLCSLLCYAIIF